MRSLFFSTAAAIAFIGALQAAPTIQSTNAAIYTLHNNPNGASIIAVKVGQDGMLSSPTMISTGGKGLSGVTAPGQPGVGSLFSADAIVVEDNVSVQSSDASIALIWLQSISSPLTLVPIPYQCSESILQIPSIRCWWEHQRIL